MLRNLVLVGFFIFIVITVSTTLGSSVLCYQETANVSTVCGGLDTGSYGLSGSWNSGGNALFDEDYSTSDFTFTSATFFVNYSKPSSSVGTSLWQSRQGSGGTLRNSTLPSGCFSLDPLQFRFTKGGSVGGNATCWDGTRWDQLFYDTNTAAGGGSFFEETMIWDLVSESLRISLEDGRIEIGDGRLRIYG